jgi:hypothetical protein
MDSMPQPTQIVQPAKKSRMWLIVAIIVGAVIVVCCGIGGLIAAVSSGAANTADSSDTASSAPASQSSAAPPKTENSAAATKAETKPPKQAAGLNTPVRDGKFEFTATAVECGKPSVGEDFLRRKPRASTASCL